MKACSILGLLFFMASCNTSPAEWKKLDFGSFSVKAPGNWAKFNKQGIDAYVGGLTNGKDSLWVYYGRYISGFRDESSLEYLFAQDTVNGKIAEIRIPEETGNGSIEMFIEKADADNKFILSGYDHKDTNLIFRIFRSVAFENSDTTKNGTFSSAKFKKYPFGSGRTLFNASCSPCHSTTTVKVGPALNREILNSRTKEWLYTFLKDKSNLIRDSAYVARKKEFDFAYCPEFGNYSKEDIMVLINYLKDK